MPPGGQQIHSCIPVEQADLCAWLAYGLRCHWRLGVPETRRVTVENAVNPYAAVANKLLEQGAFDGIQIMSEDVSD